MSTLRKQFLVGLAAVGIGIASVTAHAHPGMGGMGGGERHERMQERIEKHAAELRGRLNLNADQQKAWDAYVSKMKPGEHMQRPSREEFSKLTAPERMEKMHELMKQGEQHMAARVAATREFYAVLTPEQRKVFDENFHMGRGHHAKGMRGKS